MQRWDFANPAAPVALRPTEPDRPSMQLRPAIYEETAGELRPVYDWRRVSRMLGNVENLPRGFHLAPDVNALTARLGEERALLGEAQEAWLVRELANSSQASVAWRVIANQVLMAPVIAPDLSATPAALATQLERLRPGVSRLLELTRFPFPLNTDAWDGYPAARERVLAAIRAAGGATLVLAGDLHSAWASELEDGSGRVAVELGATSVTSPSDASYFAAAGIDFAGGLRARNPHIKWTDQINRGFLVVTLTHEAAQAEFFNVSTVIAKDYTVARAAAFRIAAGSATGAITPA